MCEYTGIAITFLLGFATAIFAEPIRRWLFRSNVSLVFQPRIGFGRRCVSLSTTTKPDVMAKYVRVLAKCSSKLCVPAIRCRAFLTRIERRGPGETKYTELHHDPIPLNWAYIGSDPLDISPGMKFYFDVVAVNSSQNLLEPQTTISPVTWAELLKEPGRYRFSIELAGDNVGPVPETVEFEWKGNFNSLTEDCF